MIFPKVFKDYTGHPYWCGKVDALPTLVFCYCMRDGQETVIDIDLCKMLLMRLQDQADYVHRVGGSIVMRCCHPKAHQLSEVRFSGVKSLSSSVRP